MSPTTTTTTKKKKNPEKLKNRKKSAAQQKLKLININTQLLREVLNETVILKTDKNP